MSNMWIQINKASGVVELVNMDSVNFILKNQDGSRVVHLTPGKDPLFLAGTDTTSSKTQAEVEAFFGHPFIKVLRANHTIYAPVSSLDSIRKAGVVIEVQLKGSATLETVVGFSDISTEF